MKEAKKNKYKLPLTGKALLAIEYSALRSAGYSASDLISAGYSLSDLRSAGYSLSDLISAGYSLRALISAGYSASDLRSAGYSLRALRSAGYSLSDLRSAGYSLSDLISAGYSLRALISAGYSASDLRSAGYSASDLISAGYSLSDLKELEKLIKSIPKLDKPYSRLWKDIQEKKRCHMQSKWGPDEPPAENNICGTPMCTAGHLVNMAGPKGYELKNKTSWRLAATIIHQKAHPDLPCQNFGSIPQDLALEYIKQMAEIEEGK